MSTVIKTSTTTINRSADDVFSELNDNFLDITNWAGGVKSSKANPATPTGFNGSAHGGRVCDVEGVGLTDERVAAFDKERRMISYTVSAEKLPSFLARLQNTWKVSEAGADRSTVDVKIEAETKGVMGSVGAIPLGRMLGKAVEGLPNDLKQYMERG
ncbi:MAG: SRPBCC family protein [Acidimicrobiales bacterium]